MTVTLERPRRIVPEKSRGCSNQWWRSSIRRIAWRITTESLNAEVEALTPKGLVIGVSDANHTFLELRLKHRMLVADFYAADSFAKDLPNAHQLKAFSAIETAFFEVNALTEN